MIRLEPFSEHRQRALSQARCLNPVINRERSWLETVQPGTVQRYQSIPEAANNIQRIALHWRAPDVPVEACLVRRSEAVIGLATVIRNQLLVHPEAGQFFGDDVDYWLRRGETPETHQEVTRQLLAQTGRTALATTVENHPNPPVGLPALMEPVGEPARLTTGDRHDTFEVARPGETAQLLRRVSPSK